MGLGLTVLHIGLAFTAFLIVLNGYLRGAKKAQIDAVLSLVWLGLLAVALFAFSWRAAVFALLLSFVYAIVAKPIAAALARALLGYRTAVRDPSVAEPDFSVERLLRSREETDRRLAQIARKPDIAQILQEERMTAQDLKEQFWFLMRVGVGDLSWEIVSKPKDLRLLLQLRQQPLSPHEIAHRLIKG